MMSALLLLFSLLFAVWSQPAFPPGIDDIMRCRATSLLAFVVLIVSLFCVAVV